MKAVPLHHPSKSSAFGTSDNIHYFAGLEDVHPDGLTYLKLANVVGFDFPQVTGVPTIFQVTLLWLVQPLRFPETQLDCLISIGFLGLDLGHHARSGFDDSDRDYPAIVTKDLAHSNFSAQISVDHARLLRPAVSSSFSRHNLIEMSTPAGKFSRVRESMVLDVGSNMSISRLWVRISKCSRESLST